MAHAMTAAMRRCIQHCQDCDRLGRMKACAERCRQGAASCREMASMAAR